MSEITKPVFTSDELDPAKTGITVGMAGDKLAMGFDFSATDRKSGRGIIKKRRNHTEINKFAAATFFTGPNEIWFGVKFAPHQGLNEIAKSAIQKYEQLLEYYLRDSGWDDIKQDKFSHNFIIKLNNSINLANLLALSSSIGFVATAPIPLDEDIARARGAIQYQQRKKHMAEVAKRKTRD